MPGKNLSWIARLLIIVLVVGVRLVFQQDWIGSALVVSGWIIGNLLAEADHLFYVAVCSPQELSCQRVRFEVQKKNWGNAWGVLKETAGERIRLPVHNVLTGLVVALLGMWLVTSSVNLLAAGVVVGLGVRLYFEFVSDANFGKWYWLFGREFGVSENKVLKFIWGGLLLLQIGFLVRG
jgi:hypothetical protein